MSPSYLPDKPVDYPQAEALLSWVLMDYSRSLLKPSGSETFESRQMVTAAMKLKDTCSLEEKL